MQDKKVYKKHRKDYFNQMHKASSNTDWEQMNQDYKSYNTTTQEDGSSKQM